MFCLNYGLFNYVLKATSQKDILPSRSIRFNTRRIFWAAILYLYSILLGTLDVPIQRQEVTNNIADNYLLTYLSWWRAVTRKKWRMLSSGNIQEIVMFSNNFFIIVIIQVYVSFSSCFRVKCCLWYLRFDQYAYSSTVFPYIMLTYLAPDINIFIYYLQYLQ